MTAHTISLPDAARRLGTSPRRLRQAVRKGSLPTPPRLSATSALPEEWVASARAAIDASPGLLNAGHADEVAHFARYEGTSAWRKYRVRVRAYAQYLRQSGSSS